MDYSNITLLSLMKTKMAYLAERQDVLAGNISQADVPGAKAEDLKPLDFRKLALIEARRLDIRATSPSHITDVGKFSQDFRTEKQRKTFETTPVKNSIVIEEQMMKVADNNMQYQMTTSLYKRTSDLFKIALEVRN